LNTLTKLRTGALTGVSHLQLAENLTDFPEEIFTLADTLEVLDLSNNQLSDLPANFAKLTKLKRLFLSFHHLPVYFNDTIIKIAVFTIEIVIFP